MMTLAKYDLLYFRISHYFQLKIEMILFYHFRYNLQQKSKYTNISA